MTTPPIPSRQEVEDLFFKEAALLDEWRLARTDAADRGRC